METETDSRLRRRRDDGVIDTSIHAQKTRLLPRVV